MQVLLIILAILLLIAGHTIKSLRWKQLISTFEDIRVSDLLSSMAIGQAINMVIPFRVGDLFKIWRVGTKNLKNGLILSAATVFIDIFIDILTVGLAFAVLFAINVHNDNIRSLAIIYVCVAVILFVLCCLIWFLKKHVKIVIKNIAGLFNNKIEQGILMEAYTVFASIKDVFKPKNFLKLFLYTIGIWGCYFLSYDLFASFMQYMGYDLTLTGVFETIFSLSGNALLFECLKSGGVNSSLIWFSLYLFVPLLLIIVTTLFIGKAHIGANKTSKQWHIIPQMNNADRLGFLEIYFSDNGKRDFFDTYLLINRGVNVIRDCSAGSNATTILAMDEEKTFYRKYAIGSDAQKLAKQEEWIEKHKDIIPLCKVIKCYSKDEIYYYDMEYDSSAVGMFRYIHMIQPKKSWAVIEEILTFLKTHIYEQTKRPLDNNMIKEYADEKIVKNYQKCTSWLKKNFEELYFSDYIYINGKKCRNLKYFEKYLDLNWLQGVFRKDIQSDIHGDLTIENIVCMQNEKTPWYLIDPNTENKLESPFLDYAKLLQSLHGKYEFLMMVQNVAVDGNCINYLSTESSAYNDVYSMYKDFLFSSFSYEEVKSIYT